MSLKATLAQRLGEAEIDYGVVKARLDGSSTFAPPMMHHERQELIASGDRLLDRIADLRRQIAEIDHAEAQTDRARVVEERGFWFKRFFTTLSIGHAAAFLALGAGLLQVEQDRATLARALYWPMFCFANGVVSAGLIPLALYLDFGPRPWRGWKERLYRPREWAYWLAAWSAGAFVVGGSWVLEVVHRTGHPTTISEQRAPAGAAVNTSTIRPSPASPPP